MKEDEGDESKANLSRRKSPRQTSCIGHEQNELFGHFDNPIGNHDSHDSYFKCYVKAEIMGCNGSTLRWGPECQNHNSGHLDKDSI